MKIALFFAVLLALAAFAVFSTHQPQSHQRTQAEIDAAIESDMSEAKEKSARNAAYNLGLQVGASYGAQGYAVPTDIVLRQVANEQAQKHSVSMQQRDDWTFEFRLGFQHGYKEVTKKAF